MAMATPYLALLLLLANTASSAASQRCASRCADAPPRSLCLATCLLNAGQYREAAAAARRAAEAGAEKVSCSLWEARAYLAAGNAAWAERALSRQAGEGDVAAWRALVYLQEGDLALARQVIESARVAPSPPALANRWRLLGAWTSLLSGETSAAAQELAQVDGHAGLYPEDRAAWVALSRRADGDWQVPFAVSTELLLGHTSNSLAGSPADPGRGAPPGGLARFTLEGRWTGMGRGTRSLAELAVRGLGLRHDSARELSYIESRARLGAVLGRSTSAAVVGELLTLPQQTEQRYYSAVRGEVERQLGRGGALVTAMGRRWFRDPARTRWEAELGGGGRLGALTLGGTVRWHDAVNPAYDLRGVLVAASSRLPMGRGATLQATASVGHSFYYHSGGLAGLVAHGTTEKRRDLSGRLALTAWSRVLPGVRVGVGAELARQDSTADRLPGFDFDYRERRVTLKLRWQAEGLGWTARTIRPADHVPLPWGLAGEDGLEGRVLDLLRQDEELRRASSCGA